MKRAKWKIVDPRAKGGAVRYTTVRNRLTYAKDEELRILGLLLLVGRTIDEAMQTVFNLRPNEVKFGWNRILATGRLSQVMSETIQNIYERAGVKIEDLIRVGAEMIHNKRTPATVRASLIMRFSESYLDRAGVGKEHRMSPMVPIGIGMDPRVMAQLQASARDANLLPPEEVPIDGNGDGHERGNSL